jgi:hypothetical protein
MKFVEGVSEAGYAVWLYTKDNVFFDVLPTKAPSKLRVWLTKLKLIWFSAFAS